MKISNRMRNLHLHDDIMIAEIIKILTAINDPSTVMSDQVLTWAKWVET